MKHHVTFQGLMFTILLGTALFIIIADFNNIRYSQAFVKACENANGQIVGDHVCVKPGSIIHLDISNN